MSSKLYDDATRVVSIALFPAYIGLGAVLLWELPPVPPVTSTSPARRAFDETLVVPDLRVAEETVAAKATLAKPKAVAPRAEPTASEEPPTRHCEDYAMFSSSSEKVVICEWR